MKTINICLACGTAYKISYKTCPDCGLTLVDPNRLTTAQWLSTWAVISGALVGIMAVFILGWYSLPDLAAVAFSYITANDSLFSLFLFCLGASAMLLLFSLMSLGNYETYKMKRINPFEVLFWVIVSFFFD